MQRRGHSSPLTGTNLQTFTVTIRSQNPWLPMTATVTSAITPSNQPPARISTTGSYPSPRGCTGTHAERRHGRSHEHRRRFLRRRLCVPGAVDIPWPRRVVKDRIIAVPIDRAAPLTFLRTAFHEDDWVAVFLKSYQSAVSHSAFVRCSRFRARSSRRGCAPRTRPERTSTSRSIPWHHISARGAGIPSARFDTSSSTLTSAAQEVLDAIETAPRCPSPSYVMWSSPGRAHLFWRVSRFTSDTVEALEKHLARKLGTDPAATACTQVTRLPGFVNHKRATPYRRKHRVPRHETACTSRRIFRSRRRGSATTLARRSSHDSRNAVVRARQYVAAIPPAISGQHGDVHTFRVCCRVVRGFALADDEALDVLREWNSRCEPPWSDRELMDKLSRAHRYGREPIGCLLEERP